MRQETQEKSDLKNYAQYGNWKEWARTTYNLSNGDVLETIDDLNAQFGLSYESAKQIVDEIEEENER